MPSPSKIKGSTYERDVAARLTALYGETFIRNISGSGSYVGGSNSYRKQHLTEGQIRSTKGDIVPPDSFARLNAECKSYGSFAFHQLWHENKLLESWVDQLMTAGCDGDLNVLFFKVTRQGQWVAVQATVPWHVDNCNHFYYMTRSHGRWIILDLENFFKYNLDQFKIHSNSVYSTLYNSNRSTNTLTEPFTEPLI